MNTMPGINAHTGGQKRVIPKATPDGLICGLFLAPSLFILILMVAYPFVSLLYYSTLRFSVLRPLQGAQEVGLLNYTSMLTDVSLWQRFIFTGQFVLSTVIVQFVIGIAVAYAFSRDFRGRDLIFTMTGVNTLEGGDGGV